MCLFDHFVGLAVKGLSYVFEGKGFFALVIFDTEKGEKLNIAPLEKLIRAIKLTLPLVFLMFSGVRERLHWEQMG